MRKDGRYLRETDAMYKVACHIMKERSDSMNMVEMHIPYEPMHDYILAKRREGKKLSHMTLIIAAYLRATAEFPQMNRFVVNKRVYARNEFTVGMVVLKPGQTNDTMNKIYLDLEDDVFTVEDKLTAYIEENRKPGEHNKTDRIISVLVGVPGLLRFGVGFLKTLDKFGLLPRSIIEASPFHCTFVISNLGSIRSRHIFHHIYNFGTTSAMVTIGSPEDRPVKTPDGVAFVRSLPLGVVTDERIANGQYMTLFMHRIEEYLKDPKRLEGKPETVIREYLRPKKEKKKRS